MIMDGWMDGDLEERWKKENFREKSLKGSICVFLLEYRTDKGYYYGRFCHIQFTRIPKRMV